MSRVVPETWEPHLRTHHREDLVGVGDFRSDLRVIIRFSDGSHVLLDYVFAIRDEVGAN